MTDRSDYRSAAIGKACAALYELALYLRSEKGCSWDRAQTIESMHKCLRDETEELGESIKTKDSNGIVEEWGDVCFVLLMIAVMAEENESFKTDQAMRLIEAKMMRRHPHVFGSSSVSAVEDIIAQWNRIKSEEKNEESKSLMNGESSFYSALKRATHVQNIAAEVGFDWPNREGILEKIEEESAELREAVSAGDMPATGAELGDLLFSCVNLARFVGLDAETLLNASVDKFIERFKYIESKLHRAGKTPRGATPAEMDALWEQAKRERLE